MTLTQKTPTTDNTDSSARSAGADHVFCRGCPDAHQCRQVWSLPQRGNLNGARLVLASAAAFLLPVLTALLAAVLVGRYLRSAEYLTVWQGAAAALGLVAGALIGRRMVRLISGSTPPSSPTPTNQESSHGRQQ